MIVAVQPSTGTQVESVTLNILTEDDAFVGVFDSIEVWRSRGSEGGPYEELTGAVWSGARIPIAGGDLPSAQPAGQSVNVASLTLPLLINEQTTIVVALSGTNPLTFAQVASQIQAQGLGRLRAWVDANAQLVIETTEPGLGATLRVLPSDAASLLGLPLDEEAFAFGHEARIATVPGVGSYLFHDKTGSSKYFYKTRFRNRYENTVSEFGPAYSAKQAINVDPDKVVTGYLDLIDAEGRALVGLEVSLRTPFVGQLVAGALMAGQALLRKTDDLGHVEFTLVRGQTYVLAIAGTNLAKEIVAPTDASINSFLLVGDTFATQDDYFRARVPQIPSAERRSL